MPRCLLWNVQKKRHDELVTALVEHERVALALLVEAGQTPAAADRLGLRRIPGPKRFAVLADGDTDVEWLTAIPPTSDRSGFWRVRSASGRDGLLALVHGYDRRNYRDNSRAAQFRQVVEILANYEARFGHRRTLVAGDLNAHPFEPAVCGTNGFHAVGARAVRDRSYRTVDKKRVDLLYNPMWGLYGHTADAGSATYHRVGTDADELVWHMLDQVLVRPEAADLVPRAGMRIATTVGGRSLLTGRGTPDQEVGSDHLPILFDWNL